MEKLACEPLTLVGSLDRAREEQRGVCPRRGLWPHPGLRGKVNVGRGALQALQPSLLWFSCS